MYIYSLLSLHDSAESLAVVREWLKQLPTHSMESVDCGSLTLDEPQIAAVEKAVADMQVHALQLVHTHLTNSFSAQTS